VGDLELSHDDAHRHADAAVAVEGDFQLADLVAQLGDEVAGISAEGAVRWALGFAASLPRTGTR